MNDLAGRRATVWGLGAFGGGAAAARWLVGQGARVTVVDQKPAEALAPALEALRGLPIRLALGGEREEDLLGADLVVKNPAIPPSSPWVARLAAARVRVTAEIALALERVTVPYALVTGSKGKSTTSALLGAMLAGDGAPVKVAGNNERPLLDALPGLGAGARLVIEVSSFMAEALREARGAGVRFPRPKALLFTSLSPEHLNWHGAVEAYYGAKLSLLELEPELVAWAADDPESARLVAPACGARPARPVTDQPGALFPEQELRLLGRHNLQNARLAAVAAEAMGATPGGIAAGVRGFTPLEHRLEPVAVSRRGVRFVNDSTATTPEAAIAALESLEAPLVVLIGGSDKGVDYSPLARAAASRAHAAVCLGQIGPRLADEAERAVREGRGAARVVRAGSFDEAFARALELCPAGGAVLLAPGCASYDMFPNFKARGERFRELARAASQE